MRLEHSWFSVETLGSDQTRARSQGIMWWNASLLILHAASLMFLGHFADLWFARVDGDTWRGNRSIKKRRCVLFFFSPGIREGFGWIWPSLDRSKGAGAVSLSDSVHPLFLNLASLTAAVTCPGSEFHGSPWESLCYRSSTPHAVYVCRCSVCSPHLRTTLLEMNALYQGSGELQMLRAKHLWHQRRRQAILHQLQHFHLVALQESKPGKASERRGSCLLVINGHERGNCASCSAVSG